MFRNPINPTTCLITVLGRFNKTSSNGGNILVKISVRLGQEEEENCFSYPVWLYSYLR